MFEKIKNSHPLNFLIHSSIYLSLGAASVSYTCMVLLQTAFKWEPMVIAFFGTFFLYNLNKKTDEKEDEISNPERVEFIEANGTILFYVSMVLYVLSLVLALINGITTFIFAIAPFIFVLLYGIIRLKRIFLIKNIIPSLGWGMIAFLTASYTDVRYFNQPCVFTFTFIFIRLLLITIVFDVKDISGDKHENIRTIANIYGIKTVKTVSYLLNSFSGTLFLILPFVNILPDDMYVINLVIFWTFFYIYLIGKINIKFLSNYLMDGELILLSILAFASQFI